MTLRDLAARGLRPRDAGDGGPGLFPAGCSCLAVAGPTLLAAAAQLTAWHLSWQADAANMLHTHCQFVLS